MKTFISANSCQTITKQTYSRREQNPLPLYDIPDFLNINDRKVSDSNNIADSFFFHNYLLKLKEAIYLSINSIIRVLFNKINKYCSHVLS